MELRPLDPSSGAELDAVLALFRLVYRRELSEAFYKWRFLENPFGPPMVSLLWDGSTLAGHYAVSPMQSRIRRTNVLTAQSMTTMTHPDYRSQGVFMKLATDLYTRMADMGVRMVWGFPNTQSHYGFIQRLGWSDIGVVVTMTREVAAGSRDVTPLSSLAQVDDSTTRLFECGDDGRVFPSCRDARYLKWRYLDNPSHRYEVLAIGSGPDALAVVKSYQVAPGITSLEVVDVVHGGRPDVVAPLFAALLTRAHETGHRYLRTWMQLSDPAFPALEKLAFAPKEPIAYFGGRTLGGFALGNEDLQLSRWSVSMGDSDNY
jgi:hypothetical protein